MRVLSPTMLALATTVAGLTLSPLQGAAQETTHVGWTDFWSYNESTTTAANLHGTGWQLPGYNTNSAPGWKTGQALFGNDDAGPYNGAGRPFVGGINGFLTPLNKDVAAAGDRDRVTFYFIKKFNFSGPANSILEAKWVHDDGIVVYINGTEATRSKMTVAAPDPVTWDTLGANHDAAGFPPVVVEGFEYIQDLDSSLLVQGENTIAVELHQSSLNSSDVAFALQLKTIIPFGPNIVSSTQPTNRVVLQNRSTTLACFAEGSRPMTFQWFFEPIAGGGFNAILDATNSTYTISSMQEANDGNYYCEVINPVGTASSRTARVQYSTDSTPPIVARTIGSANHATVVVEFNEAVESGSATDAFNYEVYDALDTPLGVTGTPVLNPGGKSVTLTLTTPMAAGAAHRANVQNVADTAGNIMSEANSAFSSWADNSCGGVLFEAFDTSSTPGTGLGLLTSHPNFPNNPRSVFRIDTFNTTPAWGGIGDTDPLREQYGGRMRALFVPPYSGAWRFFLYSDDAGEIRFNPNGPDAAGSQRIAIESGCCNVFTEPPSARTSAPQELIGGQAYYIEALYKEGGGGDYGRVAARADGDATPAATLLDIQGSMLGLPAIPANILGAVSITQQPANQSVVPNSAASFSVATSSGALLCYQWMRNGSDIPNANNPSYSFTATSGDNGAVFSVRITVPGGGVLVSADATLSVAADTIRPTVVSASTVLDGSSVTVTYSEPMEAASAGNAANYSLNGIAPSAVTVNSSTVVTLTPASPLADCVTYAVVITGVRDLAANLINPNPTSLSVIKPITLVKNDATQIWTYDFASGDLGTAWREVGYDDSAWASGPGPLSFPDTEVMPAGWPVRTTLTGWVGANITTYFRTKFNLATAPGSITNLRLNQVLDDGSIIWVNGKTLLRNRVDAGAAYATQATGAGAEPHPLEGADVPTADLVYGENTIAVEVHQSGTASSDIVFGMELIATVSACVPPLTVTRSGSNVIVSWPDPSFRLERASSVTGPWTSQAGGTGLSLPAGSGTLVLRLVSP